MKPGRSLVLISLSLLLLAAGCTVGPDYVRPEAVETMPESYRQLEGWKVAQPRDLSFEQTWWQIYRDPVLNDLAEQVADANQDIAVAEARYRQARALVGSARAGLYPGVAAGASVTRTRLSENSDSGQTFTSYQLPLDFSWELDLWGRVRRGVEASRAGARASAAEQAAAILSAQAELTRAYFQSRAIDAQRELLQQTIEVYRETLDIAKSRYTAGATTKVDVLQAESRVKTTEAQVIDLGVQRAQLEHAIAALIGKAPSAFSLAPAELVEDVPVVPAGLPSEILERRPDIAAAERRMAAANAGIGVARAAYFPTLRISASGGLSSSSFSDLLEWPSHFWSIGPLASLSLLDGGLRNARTEEARAVYDETVASYRSTVLRAFQEVEDSLAALRILEQEAEVQGQALDNVREVVDISMRQYQAGTVAYLNVLVNQTAALTTEREALNIHARRLLASVQLVKALGGDWQADSQQ